MFNIFFDIVLWVAVGTVTFVTTCIGCYSYYSYYSYVVMIVSAIALAAFNLWDLLSLMNHNGIVQVAEIEIGNGVVSLRITQLLITYYIIIETHHFIREGVHKERRKWIAELMEMGKHEEVDAIPTYSTIIGQYGVYLWVMGVLFYFNKTQHADYITKALNWGLLYIVDDWRIISDYLLINGRRIIRGHLKKVLIFNGLFFTGILFLLIFNLPDSTTGGPIGAAFLYFCIPPNIMLLRFFYAKNKSIFNAGPT
jgi:hypothetical protein